MKRRYIFVFLAVILSISFLFFTSFYNQAKQEAIKNTNNEHLLYARQAARGIEDFFNNWTQTLTALSEIKSVINLDERGKEDIELLYRANRGRIRAITRVDATGTIIYTFPFNRDSIGKDISNQNHVREIRQTHKPVISNVFSAVQGYDTVALQVPVFRDKIYQGTIGINVNFHELAKRYLEDIKIGDTGYAWMTSRDGTELYCPIPGHTGKSVFENCKDFPSILIMAQDMLKGHQGFTTYTFDKIRGDEVAGVKKHAVYMPINIGNTFWSIVVASSEDEVIASLKGFRNKLLTVIFFLMLIMGLFAYYGLKAWFIIGEEETRRRAEEALRESEERHRTIIQTAMDGFWTVDIQGHLLEVNETYCRMCGYSKEELLTMHISDLEAIESAADTNAHIQKIMVQGEDRFESRHCRKGGSLFDVEVSVQYRATEGGRLVAFLQDISKRKMTEEALKKSEMKFFKLFQSSPIIMALSMRHDGRYIDVNQAFLDKLGYQREELIGKTSISLGILQAEDRQRFIKGLLEKNSIKNMETLIRSKNGTLTPGLFSAEYIKIGEEDVLLTAFVDITERKLIEKALADSMEKYRIVADKTFDWEFWIGPDRQFIYCSPSCERITGHSPESFLSVPDLLRIIVHPDDQEAYASHVRDMDGFHLAGEIEFRIIRPDGSMKWIGHVCQPIFAQDGAFAGVRGSNRDITEHKQTEEEHKLLQERLLRSEKMEALGTLAGGVAHDLNNVLGVVVGYSEMLMGEMDESSPLREDVMKIMEGGNRSAAIVQDLLTLARRGVQTQKVVNLNDTIRGCQKTPEFESLFSLNRRIKLKTDLETDLLNILGSPVHLGKTFINLVTNAVESMPGGGELTIATRNQNLDKPVQGYDAVNEGDYVVLSIADAGEGISESDIKHVFEPFYTKKIMGRSGTGLGLAVVWGTVKDHNGYIDVQSEVSKGTTFTLYFPVRREDIAKVETAMPLSEYIGKDESILVIDDIKEQRELATKMLGKLNYRVKAVSSGEEAVEYLKTNQADLLVLDMIMDPGMDGLDTYKAILEIHPKQKAIIVSGFSETERVKEARDLGAGNYIRKPYIQEILGLAARKELDRQ